MGGGAAGFGTSARPHRPCVVLDRFAAVGGQAHHSDVDLLVRGAEPGSCAGGMVGALRELAALLEGEEWISQPTLVSARVPLIKAFAPLPPHLAPLPRSGRLALDISLDDGGHAGASSTAFTKDVLLPSLPALRPTTARAQGAEASTRPRRVHDSSLRPLVLVLKSLLASRGLSDGYTGGLTGYAIVLMAAAVLQHHEASLGRERSLGVGAALACFLETYSRDPRHAHAPHRHAVHAVTLDAGARLQPTVVCRSDRCSAARRCSCRTRSTSRTTSAPPPSTSRRCSGCCARRSSGWTRRAAAPPARRMLGRMAAPAAPTRSPWPRLSAWTATNLRRAP